MRRVDRDRDPIAPRLLPDDLLDGGIHVQARIDRLLGLQQCGHLLAQFVQALTRFHGDEVRQDLVADHLPRVLGGLVFEDDHRLDVAQDV